MARYPAQPLEEKLEWMKERQRRRQAVEAREAPRERPLSPPKLERRRRLAAEVPSHLRMFKAEEVAEMLGVSRRTVQRWFCDLSVRVPGEKGQRQIMLISQLTLENWIRAHATAPSAVLPAPAPAAAPGARL